MDLGVIEKVAMCGRSNKGAYINTKAELPKEGILFCTQFPSLGIFIIKKVGFRKN